MHISILAYIATLLVRNPRGIEQQHGLKIYLQYIFINWNDTQSSTEWKPAKAAKKEPNCGWRQIMGGDLGGRGRRSPPKCEVGKDPCIRPPNILRSSDAGCARKYEKSNKTCHQGIIFWERGFFLWRKGYDISQSKDMENQENLENMVND